MSLASDNLAIANAALITQIIALVNNAAALGQKSVSIQSIEPNQSAYLQTNGYFVNFLNGVYVISWQPPQ